MKHLSLVASAADERVNELALEDAPTTPEADAAPEAEAKEAVAAPSPFEGVADPLRKALEKRGFDSLTEVQTAVLAAGAEQRDLQISSQTGSGKTVALGLVLAPRLLEAAKDGGGGRPLAALVIVPTRELAVQVSGELKWLYAKIPGLNVECVTGGSSVGQERRRLERRPTLVVGTPGRMLDHIRTRAIDCSKVNEVVLDEADRMLDMGFREELEGILDATPSERSTHLVSATFSTLIQKLAKKYQNDPLPVQGTRLGAANQDIEHVAHLTRFPDRYDAIVNLLLLAGDERALIFVNTRVEASSLAEKLAADGFPAAPISGELEQAQRTRTLDSFRNGRTTVLVATDVAARGLDIPDVAVVIHTDAPMDHESYTHRSGRTGRAGNKGRSVLLVSPQRRKKVEYLLSRAKVKLTWADVPTAASVEKTIAKRARQRLHESLTTAAAPDEAQINHAKGLLEDMEPEVLVARLVELCRSATKAAPRKVETMPVDNDNSRGGDKRNSYRDRHETGRRGYEPSGGSGGGYRNDRSQDSRGGGYRDRDDRGQAPRSGGGYRDDRGQDSRGGGYRDDRGQDNRGGGGYRDDRGQDNRGGGGYRDDRSSGGYRDNRGGDPRGERTVPEDSRPAEFEVNWGHRGGATPQRLVALLCRRGDITSRMIGAIDIDTHTARFEVSGRVARRFEDSAGMPDSRDPDIFIRRAKINRR
ncbi:MAG: ATP-dependent RNA helicase DeaD [Hyphomicrobiaceae bacterium]|jgi:ATP-dependent RNA helicase DeaD